MSQGNRAADASVDIAIGGIDPDPKITSSFASQLSAAPLPPGVYPQRDDETPAEARARWEREHNV